jgi:preprotein translocase subunit SecA
MLQCRYWPKVITINQLEGVMQQWKDADLSSYSALLHRRHAEGETLDDLLPEAFALVREACRRRLGKRHYDVQLVGGMVLHDGVVAEMATGEGKSLTGILPAYLNALTGETVFIATVNDYLAKRDAEMFGPALDLLGMRVCFIAAGCFGKLNMFVFLMQLISNVFCNAHCALAAVPCYLYLNDHEHSCYAHMHTKLHWICPGRSRLMYTPHCNHLTVLLCP